MSGIKFLSENLFNDADITLTTGIENAQFPLINLKNDSPSIKFRSTGSTSVLLIDLLQLRDIDTLAIAFDPNDIIGAATASFKTSPTTDFTSSPINIVNLSSNENIGYVSITEVNHRFVELTLTSSIYVELSNIFIGKAVNLPQNSLATRTFNYGRADQANINTNRYGQRFIDIINQIKQISGSIEYCTKEEQDILDEMSARHGKSLPLWIIVDENNQAMTDGQFKLAMYGYLNNDFLWSAAGGQLYTTSVEMSQAI